MCHNAQFKKSRGVKKNCCQVKYNFPTVHLSQFLIINNTPRTRN